ncbi:MAG TPA: DNA methyltransferase [Stellaceae bacterium]|jgi:DNA modification methylase
MADIREGHVLDRLREMPGESVHCVVTSPPYWGLRDYGGPPQIWGGDPGCGHDDWGAESVLPPLTGGFTEKQVTNIGSYRAAQPSTTCRCCGAWRGALGLEPDWRLYLDHVVMVLREVRRVLRRDGTLWLNLGDSYAGNGSSAAAWRGWAKADGRLKRLARHAAWHDGGRNDRLARVVSVRATPRAGAGNRA